VIAAEGEFRASFGLKNASDVISQSSAALQLRYLQTLTAIAGEKNSTIIFPLPVDMLSAFQPPDKAHNAKARDAWVPEDGGQRSMSRSNSNHADVRPTRPTVVTINESREERERERECEEDHEHAN